MTWALMVTVVVLVIPLEVAEMVAVPGMSSAVRVALAVPEASVYAAGEMLPKSVVNNTSWLGMG